MPYIPNTVIASTNDTPIDGWVSDTANIWTFASSTTFTVVGDRTTIFSKGTRLKLTQSGSVKYFVVVASSHAAGTTTVTITAGTNYTFANAVVSENYYSYLVNPVGYPFWFEFVPVYGGFSADPPTTTYRFTVVGQACTIFVFTGNGTSNATNFSMTIPVASLNNMQVPARGIDNGVNLLDMAKFNFPAASTAGTANKDMNNAAWTASGNKALTFVATYDI